MRNVYSVISMAYLVAIVRPRAELHKARLLVEREVANVNFAGRFKDGRRRPDHFAGVVKDGLRQCCDHVFAVGAVFVLDSFNIWLRAAKW